MIRSVTQYVIVVVLYVLLPMQEAASVEFDFAGLSYADAVNGFSGLHQVTLHAAWRDTESTSAWRPELWSLSLGRMSRGSDATGSVQFGPTWQFDFGRGTSRLYFVEGGVHLRYFGRRRFTDGDFGSKFHFTSSLGIGRWIGSAQKASIVVDIQHTSNADIRPVNPGVDMVGLTFRYHFRQGRSLQ